MSIGQYSNAKDVGWFVFNIVVIILNYILANVVFPCCIVAWLNSCSTEVEIALAGSLEDTLHISMSCERCVGLPHTRLKEVAYGLPNTTLWREGVRMPHSTSQEVETVDGLFPHVTSDTEVYTRRRWGVVS